MKRQALEQTFLLRGWAMDQGCIDDLFRGATCYEVPSYPGDEVEVRIRLTTLPQPGSDGWGLIQWHGSTLMRMSSGLYAIGFPDGRWAWSQCPDQVLDWARA